MRNKPQSDGSLLGIRWNSLLALTIVLLVLVFVILFIVFTAHPAQGQAYTPAGIAALDKLV